LAGGVEARDRPRVREHARPICVCAALTGLGVSLWTPPHTLKRGANERCASGAGEYDVIWQER
jgi:hypothetical protein